MNNIAEDKRPEYVVINDLDPQLKVTISKNNFKVDEVDMPPRNSKQGSEKILVKLNAPVMKGVSDLDRIKQLTAQKDQIIEVISPLSSNTIKLNPNEEQDNQFMYLTDA